MSAQTIASGSRRPHVWEDLINDEIREISPYYGGFAGLGERPALLCIDNYNAVFGDRAEPLKDAIKRFPSTCGPSAWAAIEPTKKLMAAARTAGIPVLHTTRAELEPTFGPGIYSTKRERLRNNETEWNYSLFSQLAALDTEVVIPKPRASAFFGTALGARLTQLRADSIIVCGNSTSGCIRATSIDSFSYRYRTIVPEDCVGDIEEQPHKDNLRDLGRRYVDVSDVETVLAYLERWQLQNAA